MKLTLQRDPHTTKIIGLERPSVSEGIASGADGVGGAAGGLEPYDIGGTRGVRDLVGELMLLSKPHLDEVESAYNFRYFHHICEALESRGYKDRENLIGMPYDFRLVLDPSYREWLFSTFRQWIEETDTADGVVVVAHSLGAVLFKWFISETVNQDWIERYIHHFYSISAPYGGAPNSIKASFAGEHYIPFFHHVFRDELQYNSGIVMCIPNYLGHTEGDILYSVSARHKKDDIAIRLRDIPELSKDHLSFDMWKDLYAPHLHTVAKKIAVPMTAVITCNAATGIGFRTRNITEYPYDTRYGYGDGVVPARSLKAHRRLFFPELSREMMIDNSHHSKLLSDPRVILDIVTMAIGAGAKTI